MRSTTLASQQTELEEKVLTSRQREILEGAIEILATEGYSKLTLRALARKSGMKLGALQYHFRTRVDMLRGLAAHIAKEYGKAYSAIESSDEPLSLEDFVRFILDDAPGSTLRTDQLLLNCGPWLEWSQSWNSYSTASMPGT